MEYIETESQRSLRTFSFELLLTFLALFGIGLVTLYSATEGPGLQGLVKSQVFWFAIGSAISLILIFIDPQLLERLSYFIYAFCLLLLIAVAIFGRVGGGSQRWLNLGFFHLQPSELAKIAIVFAYAKFFATTHIHPPYTLKKLIFPAMLVLPYMVLILIQPDVGTAGIVFLVAGSMVLFLRVSLKSLFIVVVIGLITIPVSYRYVLKPYQQQRVKTFINPESDPRGAGYNALQSRIAVGSGKITGKGYLKGTQSQLNFLPEQHTDFIFSVFAEEWGFFGAVGLVGLYFLYCFLSLQTISRTRDKFEMLLGFGLVSIFFWHVFINLGMVVGILPIVGVTLPFMSYGGTSLVTFMMGTALILNLSRKRYIF